MSGGSSRSRTNLWLRLFVAFIIVGSLMGLPVAHAATPCSTPGSGGDWPVFQHDVTATGAQPSESTINATNVGTLKVAWLAPLGGGVEAEPVEDGGCVFMGTQSGEIDAFDVTTGNLIWRSSAMSATTLSIANGRVFVQDGGSIIALDEQSGSKLWEHDFPAPYSSSASPLAAENFVIVGLQGCSDMGSRPGMPCKGYYALLDQATGNIIVDGYDVTDADVARGMEGAGFWSHPSYDPEDHYIYFGTANIRSIYPENPLSDALLKIDADPTRPTFGKIVGYFRDEPLDKWGNIPGGANICGDTAYSNTTTDTVCINDDDMPSTAIIYHNSQGSKRIAITHSNGATVMPTYASFLYPKGNYYGIDPSTYSTSDFGGSLMRADWSAPTGGARAAAAAYDGTRMFYSSGEDGWLTAVNKDTGSVLWQQQTFGDNQWQHVTEANGVVYTPSGAAVLADGGLASLLAFNASDGTPLLQHPLIPDVGGPATGTVAGGVTIARNTVFVVTNVSQGIAGAAGSSAAPAYLIAYRLPN
ncbi:MAG: outer membrane protein assembly factor BamB family protein [Actinomycetota bacterium]